MTSSEAADFDKQFKHQTAEVNGVRIHYVIGGKGEAVVLLHGFPFTWFEWRKVMPQLATKYTVIAPDLRGTGDSEKLEEGYAKTNVAEDIRQITQQLGFEEINLVGKDIGMMVAYAYAAAHPDEVRHLALCESLIPDSGHAFTEENPDWVSDRLIRFFDSK